MLVTFPKGLECTWEVRKPIKRHILSILNLSFTLPPL